MSSVHYVSRSSNSSGSGDDCAKLAASGSGVGMELTFTNPQQNHHLLQQQQQQHQRQLQLQHQIACKRSPFSPISPLEQQGSWSSTTTSSSSTSPPAASSASPPPSFRDAAFRMALREIESKLLDDDFGDLEESTNATLHPPLAPPPHRIITKELLDGISDPEQLLFLCAEAMAAGDLGAADAVVGRLYTVVNIYGAPIQRLAAYVVEGLVARMQSSGKCLCRQLRCKEVPASGEVLSAMQVMYEVCPYIKFGYVSANGAIAEAFKGEARVHIIDFEIAQGTQYISLLQALALRPGGPPSVRITGVSDPAADVAAPGGAATVGRRLQSVAAAVNVPFEFVAVPLNGAAVVASQLGRRPGEALAVNFAMQLHHMPDGTEEELPEYPPDPARAPCPRDRLLRLAKSLAPKIVTVVEQEADTSSAAFLERFREGISYYGAVFESLEATLPRDSRARVSVEEHCLARDLVNLIACEGADRVERHEPMWKWRARLERAGFQQCPLSSLVTATISKLLRSYCDKYTLSEHDGALYLGWQNRHLISSSAWC